MENGTLSNHYAILFLWQIIHRHFLECVDFEHIITIWSEVEFILFLSTTDYCLYVNNRIGIDLFQI